MFVAGEHPSDLAQVNLVFLLEDAAGPHSGCHRVAAVDTHLLALQVYWRTDASFRIDQNCPVMKRAHQKDGYGRHGLSMGLRAYVGGNRHLADVKLVAAHHAPER